MAQSVETMQAGISMSYFGWHIGFLKVSVGRDAFINPIVLNEIRIDKEFDTIVLYFAALRT